MSMTPEEFAQKVEWEGGICTVIFDYGLDEDDLDDTDPELKVLVREFRSAAQGPYARLETALLEYGE